MAELMNSSINAPTNESTVDDSDSASLPSFVDYTPPPAVKILPPAKYKLWLIVFVLVYFASWVAADAKLLQFLRFGGWLSPDGSFFLLLAIVVFVLVYATLDLVIACLTFQVPTKIKGDEKADGENAPTGEEVRVYGIGAWLKQPRAQWMYSHENLILEILARAVHILEAGFSMFDAPPPMMNISANNNPQPFECDNRTCHRTLKIEHRIRPDKVDDYEKWLIRIRQAVLEQNGLLQTNAFNVINDEDEEEGVSLLPAQPPQSTSSSPPPHDDKQRLPRLHVVHVKFANIDFLNDWMLSPRRKALMKALEPMLVQPDVVQIQSSRNLPDAFSDLLARQGAGAPKSPPKKWKVWWLTLVALYITQKWCNSFLPYYFQQGGLTEFDDARLERLFFVCISTFLNSYVTTPLFLFLFDHWLQHSDVVAKNTRQPWRTFDEGFTSTWPKVALTFSFYGGCLIAIVVEKYA